VATVTHAATATWSTTGGNTTNTSTPVVNDLIVVVAASTGSVTTAVTDNNAGGGGTYTQVDSDRTGWSTNGHLTVWIRNNLITSATSTIVTAAQASSTGGGLDVFRVSGMTRVAGLAVRQVNGRSAGTAATTPSVVLPVAALTGNPLIAAVCNGQTVAGSVVAVRGAPVWTETADLAYSTPGAGLETMFISSGETASTITWGGASGTLFAAVVVELDVTAAAGITPELMRARWS
jgi:hypothetical protein